MTKAARRERHTEISYGRLVFGISAIVFGVVSLLWHDSWMWQLLKSFPSPLATVFAVALALAQVAGGIGLLRAHIAARAALLLGGVYTLFLLGRLVHVLAAPADAGQYVDLFEQLAVVCGAFAAYTVTHSRLRLRAARERIIRVLFALCIVSFAWAQIVFFHYTASLVPGWLPPTEEFWTVVTTVAFALAAVAALVNRRTRLALNLMALMLVIFGVLIWLPRVVEHATVLSNWSEFALNFLIAAAALLVGEFSSSNAS